jgi:ATP-dependent RNA helicase DDX24/MAK5
LSHSIAESLVANNFV